MSSRRLCWSVADAPGNRVRVDPVPARFASGLRLLVGDDATTRAIDTEDQAEWTRLCAANPRLHDSPILSVIEASADAGLIRARRDSYRTLAVRHRVDTGAVLLAVTAVLTARDGYRREHVFLGRRGEGTGVYPGLWEFGPSGGVAPPRDDRSTLSHDDLLAQLRAEIAEETGLSPNVTDARAVALLHDDAAFSVDVVFLLRLGEPVEALAAAPTWEYPEARWVPVDAVAAFFAANRVIPPARALAAFLGWSPERQDG